jgi:hypothetical protein
MWYRRALFSVQFATTIILPLWLLVGRVFFGVILGWHYAIQLFLAPLLFVFLAIITTLTWARRSVRTSGAVSRLDAILLTCWYFSIVSYGFFVVDSVQSSEQGRSVATVLFGQSFRDASFTIADISGGVVIILALLTFWLVLIEYLVETRPERVQALTGLDLTDPAVIERLRLQQDAQLRQRAALAPAPVEGGTAPPVVAE